MDPLSEFLDEVAKIDLTGYVYSSEFYGVYKKWASNRESKPLEKRRFTQILISKGFERGQFGTKRHRGFAGLQMKDATLLW